MSYKRQTTFPSAKAKVQQAKALSCSIPVENGIAKVTADVLVGKGLELGHLYVDKGQGSSRQRPYTAVVF